MSNQYLANTLNDNETYSIDKYVWSKMILAVYNFLSASTALAEALNKKYDEKSIQETQNLESADKSLRSPEVNLEDYPFFVNLVTKCVQNAEIFSTSNWIQEELSNINMENKEIVPLKAAAKSFDNVHLNLEMCTVEDSDESICAYSAVEQHWIDMHNFETTVRLNFEKQQELLYAEMIKSSSINRDVTVFIREKSSDNLLHNTLCELTYNKDTEVETEENVSIGSEFSLYSDSECFNDALVPLNRLKTAEVQTSPNRRFGSTVKSQINTDAVLEKIRKQEDNKKITIPVGLQKLRKELTSLKKRHQLQDNSIDSIKEKRSKHYKIAKSLSFEQNRRAKPKSKQIKFFNIFPQATNAANSFSSFRTFLRSQSKPEEFRITKPSLKQSTKITPVKNVSQNSVRFGNNLSSRKQDFRYTGGQATKLILLPIPTSPSTKARKQKSKSHQNGASKKESRNERTKIIIEKPPNRRAEEDEKVSKTKQKTRPVTPMKQNVRLVPKATLTI